MSSTPEYTRKTLLSGLASFALVAAAPAQAAQNPLVGAWTLETFDAIDADGSRKPRFGKNPVGYLIYTATGRMSAVLSAVRRPDFVSPDGTSKTTAARTEAISEFLAYAGTYRVRGNRVFHTVQTGVFTDLMGKTLERDFRIEGDKLTIETVPPYLWSNNSILVWRRA